MGVSNSRSSILPFSQKTAREDSVEFHCEECPCAVAKAAPSSTRKTKLSSLRQQEDSTNTAVENPDYENIELAPYLTPSQTTSSTAFSDWTPEKDQMHKEDVRVPIQMHPEDYENINAYPLTAPTPLSSQISSVTEESYSNLTAPKLPKRAFKPISQQLNNEKSLNSQLSKGVSNVLSFVVFPTRTEEQLPKLPRSDYPISESSKSTVSRTKKKTKTGDSSSCCLHGRQCNTAEFSSNQSLASEASSAPSRVHLNSDKRKHSDASKKKTEVKSADEIVKVTRSDWDPKTSTLKLTLVFPRNE